MSFSTYKQMGSSATLAFAFALQPSSVCLQSGGNVIAVPGLFITARLPAWKTDLLQGEARCYLAVGGSLNNAEFRLQAV